MNKKKENRRAGIIISTPFIWAPLVGILFLDLLLEIYHRICFPLYGIPYVNRSRYIRVDRHKLKYLGPFDKISCAYCGYANGWLNYASKVAGETEKYFCGIKHDNSNGEFIEPEHHKDFPEYGNEEEYRNRYLNQ